ncbi:MAG: hypothetical protein ACXVCY_16250 [Pseudobdellovibrionaceae bacterium]
MVKLMTVIFIIFCVRLNAYAAPVKITKPLQRRPSQESGEAYLANSTFVNFLKCSLEKSEPEVLKCIKRYFTADSSNAKILRYSEALYIAKEYTELFYCDEEIKKKVEIFEEKDYDFFLCFQSTIVPSERKTGTVYFKKTNGMPKIYRIQM